MTAADRAVEQLLREMLLEEGEGWLSEESADDLTRMNAQRLSIVDPLDGTKEFVAGIPEWCVSIAWSKRIKPRRAGFATRLRTKCF